MPNNRAAWLLAPRQRPLVINEAPFYRPKAEEVLIKNHAIAVVCIFIDGNDRGMCSMC